MHARRWGSGQPVIAIHPLGLESSAFEGVGTVLARSGFETIAVDLPGFGKTPAVPGDLTPAVLAKPVVELARSLPVPPVVLGISLGGRVALEAVLAAPESFRVAIPIAPALPWQRCRFVLDGVRYADPHLAEWLPLERLWPVLRVLAYGLERLPYLRDDEVAQAGARLVYFLSCPATRASFLSAARALMLDPADGPDGLWTRLRGLAVPAAFVWGERDRLVSLDSSRAVRRANRAVPQVLLPCVGHWVNGPHHRCLGAALAELVPDLLAGRALPEPVPHPNGVAFVMRSCVVDVARGVRLAPAAAPAGG